MVKISETDQTKEKDTNINEEAQPVEIDRVGAILYKERVKKNIDLSEISQKLCIRRYYLEAIEKGEYGNLPSMPYSAGFVDSYAKYLGLNNVRIAQLFREELDVKPQVVRNVVADDTATEAKLPRRGYVLAGFLAMVILAWMWKCTSVSEDVVENKAVSQEEIINQDDVEYYQTVDKMKAEQEENAEEKVSDAQEAAAKAEVKEPAKDAPKEVVKESAKKAEKEPVKEPEGKEVAKDEASSGIEIKIKNEDTWLEVKDENKVYLSKTLKAGESYKLPDVKGLILSSGKYSTVEVYVNGKLTPLLKKDKKTNIDIDKALKLN